MVDTVRDVGKTRDVGKVNWARWYARIIGVVLVLVGLFGFFTRDPLGIDFELTTLHNWIHILTGLVALYFGFATNVTWRAVSGFAITFGVIYLLIGIIGFFVNEIGDGLLFLTMPDNWLHILIGVAGILAGLASRAETAESMRARRPAI